MNPSGLLHVFDFLKEPLWDLICFRRVCKHERYLEKVWIDDDKFYERHKIPLESSADTRTSDKKTPIETVTFRFAKKWIYLDVCLNSSHEIMQHLRAAKLPNLSIDVIRIQEIHAWEKFWSENRYLEKLSISCNHMPSPVFLRNLPSTLTTLVAPSLNVEAKCLQVCRHFLTDLRTSKIEKLDFCLPRLERLELSETVPFVHFPNLKHFTYNGDNRPMEHFLIAHRSTLERVSAPKSELGDVNAEFPKLEYLKLRCLDRGKRYRSFPALEELDMWSLDGLESNAWTKLPTEAIGLKRLTVRAYVSDRKVPNLETYLETTADLECLSITCNGVFFVDNLVKVLPPNLRHLKLKGPLTGFLNLGDFSLLQSLSLSNTRNNKFDVEFPKFLPKLTLSGQLYVWPNGPICVNELVLKTLYVNEDFLMNVLSNLRILRVSARFSSSSQMDWLLEMIKREGNVLHEVHNPRRGLHEKFKKACPFLKIYDECLV